MDKVILLLKNESGWGGSEHMSAVGVVWPKQLSLWGSQGLAISVGNGIAMTVCKVGADIFTCAQRGKPDPRDQLNDRAHKGHLHIEHQEE